jgi:hypothetical protein
MQIVVLSDGIIKLVLTILTIFFEIEPLGVDRIWQNVCLGRVSDA